MFGRDVAFTFSSVIDLSKNCISTRCQYIQSPSKNYEKGRFRSLVYPRGRQGRPRGPNSFIFMQFSAKYVKINTTFGSWLTPSGKSWLLESHQYICTDYFRLLYRMLFAQFQLLSTTPLSNHLHGQCQWQIQDFPDGCGAGGLRGGKFQRLEQISIILQNICRKLNENERNITSLAPPFIQ